MNEWNAIDQIGALGSLLVFGTLSYWVVALVRVRVPANVMPVRAILALGGLACLVASFSSQPAALLTFELSGFSLALLFLCLDRIAPMPRQSPNIAVGSPALAFSARAAKGGIFDLEIPPGRPILLKFFRGHW